MNDTRTKLLRGNDRLERPHRPGGLFVPFCLPGTAPCFAQTITAFDPPGSTNTIVTNDEIRAGQDYRELCVDSSAVLHGFVRNPDATVSRFDPKGSTGTYATSLNRSRRGHWSVSRRIRRFPWLSDVQHEPGKTSDLGRLTFVKHRSAGFDLYFPHQHQLVLGDRWVLLRLLVRSSRFSADSRRHDHCLRPARLHRYLSDGYR